MTAAGTLPKAEQAARDAIDEYANSLFDVVALLEAAAERIDEATPSAHDDRTGCERMHNTMRLVQMAGERVKAAALGLYEHGN